METDQASEGGQPFVAHVPVPSQKEVCANNNNNHNYVPYYMPCRQHSFGKLLNSTFMWCCLFCDTVWF